MNSPNQKLNKSAHSSPLARKFGNNTDSGIAYKMQKMNNFSEQNLSIGSNSKHLSSSDILKFNKENNASKGQNTINTDSTPAAKKTSLNSIIRSGSNKETTESIKTLEFSQIEMINVAKKILAKREQHTNEQDANSSVRAMKEKFENMSNLIEEVPLTPRLLIKKFEAMSKESGSVIPTIQQSASKPVEVKTGRVVSSFLSNIESAIQSSPQCNSTKIIDCSSKSNCKQNLAPKYDIEFIDSTDTTQVTQLEINDEDEEDDTDDDDTDEDDDDDDDEEEEENEDEDSDDNSDYDVEETYVHDQDRTLTPKRELLRS